jgi:hypothetical protein
VETIKRCICTCARFLARFFIFKSYKRIHA